jgi:PadR family transcriptional regulator AphA
LPDSVFQGGGSIILNISTLSYALLARLARGSHSGYELVQAMRRPIGFFWQASQSQIYPELSRLEALDLVTYELVRQDNRPDKKVYTISDKGREVLQEWAVGPSEPEPGRNELLLKTYTIWLADPAKALKLFHNQEDYHRFRLSEYERILAEQQKIHSEPFQVHEPLFGDHATLQIGLRYEQAYVEWCHWMVEQLEHAVKDNEQQNC